MSIYDQPDLMEVITQICTAESVYDALSLYKHNSRQLSNHRFILAAEIGAVPGFAVNRKFSATGAIRSLFSSDNVFVLDRKTNDEMGRGGTSTFALDYSISLDTQALSYIENYLNNSSSGVAADFVEAFHFLAHENVNVDPYPYLVENLSNLEQTHAAEKIFETLKAYEVLKSVDLNALRQLNEIRATTTDASRILAAQQSIAQMFTWQSDSLVINSLERHQHCYSQLLKMVTIQFSCPSATVFDKTLKYLRFLHSTLATISLRELLIAHRYFTKGQNFDFFKKIQRKQHNNPVLISRLKAMAWDLWHIRHLELSLTRRDDDAARYFFPALLTFDKALVEVMDLFPLRACVFVERTHNPMPFYNIDVIRTIAEDTRQHAQIADEFFSPVAKQSREERREECDKMVGEIVPELEQALVEVAN